MNPFVHLHLHTEYSMLDGKGTVSKYVAQAKKKGMGALSVTDHGNLAATPEFYWECIQAGIEPILGCEFYFVPVAEQVKEEKEGERFHVVFLARNEAGFRTLVELSTESHKRYYYKPLIDRALLESLSRKERKNLVVLSGCAGSIISRKALLWSPGRDPLENPLEEINWWNRLFPNFYMELQHHGTSFDRKLNKRLLKYAQIIEIPHVITNDPHYVTKDEECHHDALLAIQTASDIDDPNRFRFEGSGYHLKSAKEMKKAFGDYRQSVWAPGIANTMLIARQCHTRIPAWDNRTWHIPKFPDVEDGFRELKRLAWKGLRERGLEDDERYTLRLKHELREFKAIPGMADFLLITRDAIVAAEEMGMRVGPGRGSVCGTLVGYLVGIHKIDPVKYGLLFERFLNPERPKMPDIDTDFPASQRDRMFEYAENKYGRENTMRVGAFQTLKVKSAFQSLARAHGIEYKDRNRLSEMIEEDDDGNVLFPEEISKGFPDLVETLDALKGIKKGISRHAAGVIIIDPSDPVRSLLPEMWIPHSRRFVCQFNLETASSIGLLKQDFLSLRALDTIEECVRLVKQRHGVDLDPDSWVPDEEEQDQKIYKMLREGHTNGVFQMEGGTNHRGIQEIGCSSFEDIVSCTSLYRAGPMIAGAPKRYLRNKKDKKIRVAHPSLKMFLQKTWGEMIYQEQMFEILRNLAGFSWARVDDAKTAMTRKDAEKMAKLKDEAIEGFQTVAGMSESKAEEVWETIAAQASYLFNRSHAVAYSMLTYQTARLKFLYPLEFLAALLRTVEGKNETEKEKRQSYLTEALQLGFKIEPPDINVSDDRFTPHGKRKLLFGLQDIKGVGEKAVQKILNARPKKGFRTADDVYVAVNNRGVLDALMAAGALRGIGIEPDLSRQEDLLNWQFTDHVAPFRKKYEKKIRMPSTNNGRVWVVGEVIKTEKRTTKNGNPFMTWVVRCAPGQEIKAMLWEDAIDLWSVKKGSIVRIEGRWQAQWSNVAIGDSEQVRVLRASTKASAA